MDALGGYRLIRKLGEAERAEVYLGYPQAQLGVETGGASAVKVFRESAPSESIMVEIEALTRASGPHCVRLVDLATSVDGTFALILERAAGGSLGRVLASRTRFLVGEAITILAPLAATVARLHSSGVVHSQVGPDSVLFSVDGAPTLVAFGRATLIPPGLPSARLDALPEVIAERDAFAALARTVLVLVRDENAAALVDWLGSGSRLDDWWEQVEARLFALGDPSALDLSAAASVDPQPVPTRTITAAPVPESSGSAHGLLHSLGMPEVIVDAVAPHMARLRRSLALVRKPVWLAAIAAAGALVVALALIPAESPEATADPSPTSTTRSDGRPASALTRDDPVAGLVELLALRESCFRDASLLCLDGVDQSGSSALATDQERVRLVQDGADGSSEVIPLERLILTERLGDTALIEIDAPTNGEPASILLMKGEAGWRIRDYLEG